MIGAMLPLVLALAGPSALPTTSAQPATVVAILRPQMKGVWLHWTKVPTQAEVDALIPPGETGTHYAAMSCQADKDGLLSDCTVMPGVTSPGGFEKAVLSLAGKFQLATDMIPPATTPGTRVEIVLRFGEDM